MALKVLFWLVSLLCLGHMVAGSAVLAEPALEIILDASSSMSEKMGSASKMELALSALAKALDELGDDSLVGLRVFGHRVGQGKKSESCKDSQRLIAFTKDKNAFRTNLPRSLIPLGYTSLALSISKVSEDFGTLPNSGHERQVLIISDGNDTCGGKPIEETRKLLNSGFQVVFHTLGIKPSESTKQVLSKVADISGGIWGVIDKPEEFEASIGDLLRYSTEHKGDLGRFLDAGNERIKSLEIDVNAPNQAFLGLEDAKDVFRFRAKEGEKWLLNINSKSDLNVRVILPEAVESGEVETTSVQGGQVMDFTFQAQESGVAYLEFELPDPDKPQDLFMYNFELRKIVQY